MANKVTKCVVCSGKKFNDYPGNLIECAKCGHIAAKEMPTNEELTKLYQEEYFFGMEYSDYKADRPALEYNFKKRIKRLRDRTLKKDFKIVEIGSAYGYFLDLIKKDVKDHIGFEVSTDGVEYSKGELKVNATNEDFMKYKFKNASVDTVFMWDVIEHLTEPEVYLEKINSILKPGGRVVFTTGDIGKLVPKLRKEKWRMIHPPTHVHYFTAKSATRLLKNKGFEVENIYYKGISRNLGSVANQIIANKKVKNKKTKTLSAGHAVAERLKITKLNIPVNTWDVMEVVAVKK
jgi:SAM-dependent methyltransferase